MAIMCMLIANKSLFMHAHQLVNGKIIIHAHLYNKSADTKPYKSHDHTEDELLYLTITETLFLFVLISLALIQLFIRSKYYFHCSANIVKIFMIRLTCRAPPIS